MSDENAIVVRDENAVVVHLGSIVDVNDYYDLILQIKGDAINHTIGSMILNSKYTFIRYRGHIITECRNKNHPESVRWVTTISPMGTLFHYRLEDAKKEIDERCQRRS